MRYVLLFTVFCMLLPFVIGLSDDHQDGTEAFAANPNSQTYRELVEPTYADLQQLENPSVSDFHRLSPEQRDLYISQAIFPKDEHIAAAYFSKSGNVNKNVFAFSDYTRSNGVRVLVAGHVESFKDGILFLNDASVDIFNYQRPYGAEYSYEVDPAGDLVVNTIDGAKYKITGDIRVDETGDMGLLAGSINGLPIFQGKHFHFTQSSIHGSVRSFGLPLSEDSSHLTFSEDTPFVLGDEGLLLSNAKVTQSSAILHRFPVYGSIDTSELTQGGLQFAISEGKELQIDDTTITDDQGKGVVVGITKGDLASEPPVLPGPNRVHIVGDELHATGDGFTVEIEDPSTLVDSSISSPPLLVQLQDGSATMSPENGRLGLVLGGTTTVSLAGETFTTGHQTYEDIVDLFDLKKSDDGRSFKPGDTGLDVTFIQQIVGAPRSVDRNGNALYDQSTYEAVRRWQEQRGLLVDGEFGGHAIESLADGQYYLVRSMRAHAVASNLPIDISYDTPTVEERSFDFALGRFLDTQARVDIRPSATSESDSLLISRGPNPVLDSVVYSGTEPNYRDLEDGTATLDILIDEGKVQRMKRYVDNNVRSGMDSRERFNQIMRGIDTDNPVEAIKLAAIFASREAPDGASRQNVNGRPVESLRGHLPSNDPSADQIHRFLEAAAVRLSATQDPELISVASPLFADEVASTNSPQFEALTLGRMVVWDPQRGEQYKDIVAGEAFAESLRDDPRATLENFDIREYVGEAFFINQN